MERENKEWGRDYHYRDPERIGGREYDWKEKTKNGKGTIIIGTKQEWAHQKYCRKGESF